MRAGQKNGLMTPDLISSTSQLDILFAALLRLKPHQNVLESVRYPFQKELELMSSLANSFARLKKKLQGASNTPSSSQMPSFTRPVSQLIGANQFFEDSFKNWACKELGWQFGFNRKLWEYAFILNALSVHGKLGGRGLGFGVGRDPIVSVMLRHGGQLVVSDLSDEDAVARGWDTMDFNQEANQPLKLLSVDMNHIPSDLRSFDFSWSCGSLEHIGGLNHGLQFIENAMACLKPGALLFIPLNLI